MKLKRLLPILILIVASLVCITASAQQGDVTITTAMQTGDSLVISGSISNGAKGLQVGLIIFNTDNQPIYFNQTETQGVDSLGTASFSFPVITTDGDMEGYEVYVSADGFAPCRASIETPPDKIFYVSADAADNSGDGSADSPFKTITQARNAVREYKKSCGGIMTEDIIVYIMEGDYVLNSTLSFDERDSGTNGYTVTYCAFPGETPRLIAAKNIFTDWILSSDGVWVSEGGSNYIITSLSDGKDRIGMPARTPNALDTGDAYYGAVRVGAVDSTEAKTSFSVKSSDNIPEISDISSLRAVLWPNGGGWYNWDKRQKRVTSITGNGSSRVFNLDSSVPYCINNDSRYYLEGALEFLDSKGEYYYDRAEGKLSFIPPAGFEMSRDTKIYASSNFHAISIIGYSDAVRNLRIDGLDITGTGSDVCAVYMKNAENIDIYGCRIHDLDNTAIKGHDILFNSTIEGNEISDVESGVVLVSNLYSEKISRVSHNTVINNHIYNIHGSSAGIQVAESANNIISHNKVHGSDRFGIWVYGAMLTWEYIDNSHYESLFGDITEENVYEFMRSHDNIIEYNDVYDCMKDSQDGGPIYTSRTHHNVIRYNNVHDSYIPKIGPVPAMNGLYLDDGSDYNEVYGNSIYNISGIDGGYLSVPLTVTGKNNIVTGNIVANNGIDASKAPDAGIRFYGSRSSANEASKNIFYNTGAKVLNSTYSFGLSKSDNNILYNPTLANPEDESAYTYMIEHEKLNSAELGPVTLGVWRAQRGYDVNTVAKDPVFMNAAKDDFRFGVGSPATEKGFEEIYRQAVGLKADYPYAQDGEYDKLFISIADEMINPGVIKIAKGAKAQLNTLVRNDKGFVVDGAQVTFVSDNIAVATVDMATGVVTALSAGTAKITACSGDISTDVYITVCDDVVWLEDKNGTVISEGFADHDRVRVKIDASLIYESDFSTLMPVAAVYSKDGLLLSEINFDIDEEVFTTEIILTDISEKLEEIRVFLWEKGTLTPRISRFKFSK